VVVNPVMDFTLDAKCVGVPVKAADGKTIALYRKMVDKDSLQRMPLDAGLRTARRVDPNYCVICHNPGSGDYYNNSQCRLEDDGATRYTPAST